MSREIGIRDWGKEKGEYHVYHQLVGAFDKELSAMLRGPDRR